MGFFDFLKPDVSAEDLYREAEQCFKSKDYATAVKLFEQAWDKDPDVGDFLSLSACPADRSTPRDFPRILIFLFWAQKRVWEKRL